jgi:EAL domain-containing protein (putative c-di-GMP-specific phosphodiesterase class I)/GGDEF domain-containing protein
MGAPKELPQDLITYPSGSHEGPLARLLRDRALAPVFQPIVNMQDGSIYAHEALIRGPRGMPLHTPDALIAAANREGLLLHFEIACVAAILEHWARLQDPGRLFLNLSAHALVQVIGRSTSQDIAESIRKRGLQPRMLVIELTEHEHVADVATLNKVVRALNGAGIVLALDDFGNGRSSLRLWSEIQPAIVKIDKYFTRDLSQHAQKVQTLRALMQIADVFGSMLVAEGIETGDDLRVIRDLGISYGQGYFMGRPDPMPRVRIEDVAQTVMADHRVAVMPVMRSASSSGRTKDLLVTQAPTVSPNMDHDDVAELFEVHPNLHAVALVEDGVPVGLLDRRQFMERFAKRYFKELYGRKPCALFANMAPRLVEREHSIDDLIDILTSQDQRYLTEGFIVTDNGRYIGLGTGDQLVRRVTESRIEAARHANPLTFLPGNIPLTEHIERLLASGGEFVACYGDLNQFKPFNDHYGYWRGDEMIRLMARLSVACADPQRDFIGHVGGDDFILLFQSNDWEDRCEKLVADFNLNARSMYDDAGRAAGGVYAEDRQGVMRFFSFTTLSIGAVRVRKGQFRNADDVANAAASAKHAAKMANAALVVHSNEAASPWMETVR